MTVRKRRQKAEYVDVELEVGKVRMKARVRDAETRRLLQRAFKRMLALGLLEEAAQ
jgi:hypothetical protein